MKTIRLCVLSTHTCPCHNPTPTMAKSIRHVDVSRPIIIICPVWLKPGFTCEENTSPEPDAIRRQHWPNQAGYHDEPQSGPDTSALLPVGWTPTFWEMTDHGRKNEHSLHGQQHLWWTFLQSPCQRHAPSKLAHL